MPFSTCENWLKNEIWSSHNNLAIAVVFSTNIYMEKIYTAPSTFDSQPKNETIAFIKAFAASFCVDETDDGIIFERFLN